MTETYKIFCKCIHKFQDEQYGNNVRIANATSKKFPDGTIDVRCTVCNAIHRVKEK